VCTTCAPGDHRKSSDNQRGQTELNALRCQRLVDVSGGSDLVRQATIFRWSIAEGPVRGMHDYGTVLVAQSDHSAKSSPRGCRFTRLLQDYAMWTSFNTPFYVAIARR
jgi:hypothetical protein